MLISVIGAVNVALITYLIGPADFGVYLTVVGVVTYLTFIAAVGVDVYLIRRDEEPSVGAYNQAFTLTALTSLLVVAAGALALPLLAAWLPHDGFAAPYLVMLLTLPATVLRFPPLARLERSLDYRSIAVIEVLTPSVYGVVAVTLALQGAGVWAPVIGHMVSRLANVVAFWTVARMRPRLCWSSALAGDMVRYGIGYSATQWIWNGRTLVNPLLVGGILGPEAVALVGLASKIVSLLAFVRQAAWRLAMVAMAKVQGDLSRSSRLVDEAMLAQTMAVGPFLGAFALVGPWFLSLVYGPEWQGLFVVYPFIALGTLVNAVFSVHSSQLYVRKRNLDVAAFHAVHVALFAGAVWLLVPRFGLIAYGFGEVVALCSYGVIHARLARILQPSYAATAPWLGAYIPPLFAPFVDHAWVPLLWLPFFTVVLLPQSRRQLRAYAGYLSNQWKPS